MLALQPQGAGLERPPVRSGTTCQALQEGQRHTAPYRQRPWPHCSPLAGAPWIDKRPAWSSRCLAPQGLLPHPLAYLYCQLVLSSQAGLGYRSWDYVPFKKNRLYRFRPLQNTKRTHNSAMNCHCERSEAISYRHVYKSLKNERLLRGFAPRNDTLGLFQNSQIIRDLCKSLRIPLNFPLPGGEGEGGG